MCVLEDCLDSSRSDCEECPFQAQRPDLAKALYYVIPRVFDGQIVSENINSAKQQERSFLPSLYLSYVANIVLQYCMIPNCP